MNLGAVLEASGPGIDPDELIVHAGTVSWSRAELSGRADQLVEALNAAGLVGGSPVAVMLPNGPWLVAALFGVWRAGAVYVPLNPRLTEPEIDHVLDAIDPAVVVTDTGGAARVAALGVPRPTIVVGDDGWGAPSGPLTAGRVLETGTALVQFTSGTTGRPKPVLLRHDGVLALLDGVVAKLRGQPTPGAGSRSPADVGAVPEPEAAPPAAPRPPMPNLIPVSLSLWAGIYNVVFAFRVGAPVVIMDGFDTGEFAALVRRFGIRSTVLPPAAMAMLVDDCALADLAPLRFVRSITAPLSPFQARRFHDRFGISVLNSYGQTEIGGEVIGWNAADSRAHGTTKLGSVGRPHDGVTVRITGPDGTELGVDEAGELWLQTPALAAGYADGTDLGDRLAPGGWFRTGDIGSVDGDGFVWLSGRVSDMINRGGLKVFPGEVDEVIRAQPGVVDAAVVGVPDDRLGEVPWAFVVADPSLDGASMSDLSDVVREACRRELAPYKVPVRVEVVDALPRNEIGKVVTRDLVALASGPDPTPSDLSGSTAAARPTDPGSRPGADPDAGPHPDEEPHG